MILSVTPNPCVDKTIFIDRLEVGGRIRSEKYTCVAGGKGNNVSRAVRAMGHSARPMVIVGGHTGAHVLEMLQQQDRLKPVPVWVEDFTRTVTTVLEEEPHRQTAFFEPGSHVTPEEYEQVVETFRKVVNHAKVVTFNGTVPHKDIDGLYADLLPIAKDAGVVTIVDTYGPEFAKVMPNKPYMIKPNQQEAEKHLGRPLDTMDARIAAVREFRSEGIELVVMSLGHEGTLVAASGKILHVLPPTIDEVNPVGSGDALVAGYAIGLQENYTIRDTAALGAAMGTANAMSWDIGHFTKEEVEQVRKQIRIEEIG